MSPAVAKKLSHEVCLHSELNRRPRHYKTNTMYRICTSAALYQLSYRGRSRSGCIKRSLQLILENWYYNIYFLYFFQKSSDLGLR